MKLRLLTAVTLGVLAFQAQAATQQPATTTAKSAAPTASTPKLNVDKAKVSYSIGLDLGQNFKTQGIDVDPAMLERGLKDGMTGAKPMYSQQEMAATLMDFQKQLLAKRQAEFNAMGSKNLQDGNTFLAANKTKPGVVTTSSGLQYKVINAGSGNAPTDKDIVTVDYVGSLPNGKIFDSSYQRGKPVTFPVAEVIPGWTEALKMMKPGAIYEIYVPANLAYGDRGLGNVIGPNQVLVFKIHLIAVNPSNKQA